MDKESLMRYLRPFQRVCLLFQQSLNDHYNYTTVETDFLRDLVSHTLEQDLSVCYITELTRECQGMSSSERLETYSFNEMKYLYTSSFDVSESQENTDLLIVNQFEKIPRNYDITIKEKGKLLLVTKEYDAFQKVYQLRRGFHPLIVSHTSDNHFYIRQYLCNNSGMNKLII